MSTLDADGVLAAIDAAREDWSVSDDAMRWAPKGDRVESAGVSDHGYLVVRRIDDFESLWGYRLYVDQADPCVLITAELLEEVRRIPDDLLPCEQPAALVDDVLTINAENRQVIYRIGEYLFAKNAYHAERGGGSGEPDRAA